MLTDYEKWPCSYAEDTFINWEVFQKAAYIYYVKNTGYHHRTHSNNITSSGYNKDKDAYFLVWNKLLRNAESLADEELLDAVRTHVVLESNSLIAQMYCEYQKNLNHIITRRSELLELIDKEVYKEKCPDAFFVLTEPNEIISRMEGILTEINNHKKNKVYLYGAGYVAKDILQFLNNNNCKITGVKVSEIKEKVLFEGYKLEKYEKEIDDKAFYIIAMNKKNTEEVVKSLKNNYVIAGWFSLYYYS